MLLCGCHIDAGSSKRTGCIQYEISVVHERLQLCAAFRRIGIDGKEVAVRGEERMPQRGNVRILLCFDLRPALSQRITVRWL